MTDLGWVPDGIDTNVPNVARTYDYLLGGAHNLAVDRELGDRVLDALPGARRMARINRSFLRRAVTHLVASGVDQFLDLGSGIPTAGNVHEVATRARVAYVDSEPVAVAHARLLLADVDRATAVQADLRDPDDVLSRPEVADLLDFDRPIGLLLLLALHFVPDSDDPWGVVARYRDRLAPGSHLVVTHATADRRTRAMRDVADSTARTRERLHYRTRAEVTRLFAGFDLLEPGVTGFALWRPEGAGDISADADDNAVAYAGVGVKPTAHPTPDHRARGTLT